MKELMKLQGKRNFLWNGKNKKLSYIQAKKKDTFLCLEFF